MKRQIATALVLTVLVMPFFIGVLLTVPQRLPLNGEPSVGINGRKLSDKELYESYEVQYDFPKRVDNEGVFRYRLIEERAYQVCFSDENDTSQSESENELLSRLISELLLDSDNIVDCEVIVFGNNVVVALRINGVFRQSDNGKIVAAAENSIKQLCPSMYATVFTSVREFYEVKSLKKLLESGVNPLEVYGAILEMCGS